MAWDVVRRTGLPEGEGFIFQTEDGRLVLSSSTSFSDSVDKRKWKIGVSLASGCPVGCIYCFTRDLSSFRPLAVEEIVGQVEYMYAHASLRKGEYDVVKVEMKEMGDPAVNVQNTCDAIRAIDKGHPGLLYVVSSSGVRNDKLYSALKEVREGGARIRLQFSVHTTSDEERRVLSPRLPMMSLEEMAERTKGWYDGSELVTLNFVPMRGRELSSEKIARYFFPEQVFIKISYVDRTMLTEKEGIVDEDVLVVDSFVHKLREEKYLVAYRHRALDLRKDG